VFQCSTVLLKDFLIKFLTQAFKLNFRLDKIFCHWNPHQQICSPTGPHRFKNCNVDCRIVRSAKSQLSYQESAIWCNQVAHYYALIYHKIIFIVENGLKPFDLIFLAGEHNRRFSYRQQEDVIAFVHNLIDQSHTDTNNPCLFAEFLHVVKHTQLNTREESFEVRVKLFLNLPSKIQLLFYKLIRLRLAMKCLFRRRKLSRLLHLKPNWNWNSACQTRQP